MSNEWARTSSSMMDLTIRGHLPPSSRTRQRPSTEARIRKKTKLAKKPENYRGNLRPGSVPTIPLWDENNQLFIESTSVPLSARGASNHSRTTTPTKRPLYQPMSWREHPITPIIRKVNSIKSLPSSSKHLGSQSEIELVSKTRHTSSQNLDTAIFHSKSDTNLPGTLDDLDQSVDLLSSEIDNILQGINAGIISNSPEVANDVLTANPDCKPRIENGHHINVGSSNNDEIKSINDMMTMSPSEDKLNHSYQPVDYDEEKSFSSATPSYTSLTGHKVNGEVNSMEIDAVIKIQRWYRAKQVKKRKRELQILLNHKREELNIAKHKHQNALNESAVEDEKQRRREAKMQATRQAAIDKLRRKREEKRKENERIVKEEMALIEANGKMKKSTKQRPFIATTISEDDKNKSSTDKLKEDAKQTGEHHGIPGEHQNRVTGEQHGIPGEHQNGVTGEHHGIPGEHQNGVTGEQHGIPGEHQNGVTGKEHRVTGEHQNRVTGKQHRVTGEHQNKIIDTNNKESTDPQLDEFFKAGPKKPTPPRSKSPSPSHHPTSTMDSIFATLKELEEAPPPLAGPTSPPSVSYLSTTNLQKLPDDNQVTPHGLNMSNSKLQSILTYLDEVERNEPISQGQDLPEHLNQQALPSNGLSEQLEAASTVANDVTTTIVTQRLEIENKNKTVEMLQKALTQQRELTIYHAKEMEKEAQKRLELQKQEYETTIQRHQCFIDQLIDDKKVLSDKCEELIKELKDLDRKHKTKIRTMEDKHATEMEHQKQTSVAAEKLRREKWRTDETQRIKEATVKSLEPEIQRIIARGKAEIQKLKAMHEAELLQADERASQRFIQQTEELRAQYAQEKEMACQHERELARQKYEQLAEQEERSYQQLRKKLYSELQQERDKLTAEMHGHNNAIENQVKGLKEAHNTELIKLKKDHESTLEELQRRHSAELRDLQERLKIEKQMWEENYLKKQDATLMSREREMREQLRRERDMEIETVIQKLETETATAKEECERAAESRIKRIREKYETELKEVERSEKNTLQKFNTMKANLTELEGQVVKLTSQLKLKEEEVTEINEVATRLTKERDQFADVVRQEFVDKLIIIEEENKQLKLEMSELQTRHKLEKDRLQRTKEQELAEVHNRVKQALAKKEENLKTLRSQHEAALKRADHLEMLLEQQRKELLKR